MSEEMKAYVDEVAGQLRQEIASLRSEVGQLRSQLRAAGAAPAPAPRSPQGGDPPREGVRFLDCIGRLHHSAPALLQGDLQATMQALRRLFVSGVKVFESKELALLTVELVELCEESRRSADLTHPFYETLEERLTELTGLIGLEPISPTQGQAYRPQEHLILRTVRGEARDTVERCIKRGFRWNGQLLKKAEVSVVL